MWRASVSRGSGVPMHVLLVYHIFSRSNTYDATLYVNMYNYQAKFTNERRMHMIYTWHNFEARFNFRQVVTPPGDWVSYKEEVAIPNCVLSQNQYPDEKYVFLTCNLAESSYIFALRNFRSIAVRCVINIRNDSLTIDRIYHWVIAFV